MLHVVNKSNRHLYCAQLEESFRIRHRIYAEGRGWEDIKRPDGRDFDQFDNDDATYLLLLEGQESEGQTRRVLGGSRLIPTLKPHLMSEVFPQLANTKPLPRARNVFEWTRYFVIPEMRAKEKACFASGIILAGLQEFCLEEGIDQLSIVLEPYWLPRFKEADLNPQPLGLAVKDNQGTTILGITIDVTEQSLERTRQVRGIEGPVLVYSRPRRLRPSVRVPATTH